MSVPERNTFIGMATLAVISIAAAAAVIQLRHLRRANELAGMLSVLHRVEDLDFQRWVDESRKVIASRMPDAAFRQSIVDGNFDRAENPCLSLANSYEWLGSLVRRGLIAEEMVMDLYGVRIIDAWNMLRPIIALRRRRDDLVGILENFEFLYVRAQNFRKTNPVLYRHNVPHSEIKDDWAEADGIKE